MSSEDKPQKPLPSPDEINAYLELSAARTRKRLPLAFGKSGASGTPGSSRGLPVAEKSPATPSGALPVAAAKPRAPVVPAGAASTTRSEDTWQPFEDEDGGGQGR